jgi:hypothetical protein
LILSLKNEPNLKRKSFTAGDCRHLPGLIFWKLAWAKESHSEMQVRDIRNLLESGADEAFLDKMITKHGLNDAWQAFLEWKTRIVK